jgi:hypothetical protein
MNCPHCQNPIPDGSQFCNHCGMSTVAKPKQNRGKYVYFLWAALAFFGLWFAVRYTAGSRPANRMVAAIAHTPITLVDEVQNLPASSWKGLALSLPYNGSIDVDLRIVQGNPMDVFITDADQLDAMNRADWKQVRAYPDFNAVKTKTYRRTGQLRQGSYYLVIRDTSLGILSQSASDVAVKATLNP